MEKAACSGITVLGVCDHDTVSSLDEAVAAYATLGEMADVLRRVFGEFRPGNTLGGV